LPTPVETDPASRFHPDTRHGEVLETRPEDDQIKTLQSKPTVVPVKLTKLEPLSKDRADTAVDSDVGKPAADVDQKSSTEKPQQTRSGSPSLSVVRLTKLEPLSFDRVNGSTSAEQPGVEPPSDKAPATSGQRAEEEPPQIQQTTEDMIVPVPSARQSRGRPAWPPTTTVEPDDDDLELRHSVDETPIQAQKTVYQFAVPPSSIMPVSEDDISETVATAAGCLLYTAVHLLHRLYSYNDNAPSRNFLLLCHCQL